MSSTQHHAGCDCEHHATKAPEGTGWWSSLLPLLACAVCPACLSAYAKLLSAFGVGVLLSERQHTIILTVAVGCSIAVSGWRSVKGRRWWPLAISLLGSALVVSGHLAEHSQLEWAGVLTLLVGGLAEMPLLRRILRPA